jgi:hypothetical protein
MTAEDYFEDGNRLFRDDLYWAALLRYRQASEAGLASPLLHYNTGVAHYRAGQHLRARDFLTRALDAPSLQIAAQYNLGLNAYKLGQTDEALRWFRLARDQQQNKRISEYAAVAIARIRSDEAQQDPIQIEKTKRREQAQFAHLELRAQISFGNDDNVYRTPGQDYLDFADPDFPIILPVVVAGAYMPYSLSAKYKVNAYSNEGFFGAYRLAGRHYLDKELENANSFSHELGFGSEYRKYDEERDRERELYSAFTVAQHDEVYYDPDDGLGYTVDGESIDSRMNYLRYGPELAFRQSHEHLTLGFNLKGQLWNYDDTEVVPEYDHEYFLFGLLAQYNFTPTSLLSMTVEKASRRFGDRPSYDLNGNELIGNPNLRYDYLDISIAARQRISPNLWFGVEYLRTDRTDKYVGYNDYIRDVYSTDFFWAIGSRFEVSARADYQLYNFARAYAFNDPLRGRKTLERVDFEISASYRVTPRFYVVFEAGYVEKVSNDIRIAYDRSQYLLGVRWSQ